MIPVSGRSAEEGIGYPLQYSWPSLMAQLVENPPAMWETWIQSLGWEDPLKKGTATHSSILAWRIPCIVVHGVARSKNKNNLLQKVALFFFSLILEISLMLGLRKANSFSGLLLHSTCCLCKTPLCTCEKMRGERFHNISVSL